MDNDGLGADKKKEQAFIALFSPGQRVCFQSRVNGDPVFYTFPFNGEISGNFQFLVLNPFQPGCTARNQEGVLSRQGFTVEQDRIPLEMQREWFAFVLGTATVSCFSESKSIHNHVVLTKPINDSEEKELVKLLKMAFPFSDWKVISDKARLCRTPGAIRDNGKEQTIESIGDRKDLGKMLSTLREKNAGKTSYPEKANCFMDNLSQGKYSNKNEIAAGKKDGNKNLPSLTEALKDLLACGYTLASDSWEFKALACQDRMKEFDLPTEIEKAKTALTQDIDQKLKAVKIPKQTPARGWKSQVIDAMADNWESFYTGRIDRIRRGTGGWLKGFTPGEHHNKQSPGFCFRSNNGYFVNFYDGRKGFPQDYLTIYEGLDIDTAWKKLAEIAGVEAVDRCQNCTDVIEWKDKKPYNTDGTGHKCKKQCGRSGHKKVIGVNKEIIAGEVVKEYPNFLVTTSGVFAKQVQDSTAQEILGQEPEVTYLKICPDPVIVKDRVKIAEEEESAYVALAWGNEETIVPLSYLQAKNADKLADRGVRILSTGEAKLMTQYFSEALREEMPCRTVYKQLGWHGQEFVLPGMVEDRAILPEAKLSYRVHQAKTEELEKATDALHRLIEVDESKGFLVLLLHSLIAPAAKLLDIERFKFVLFPIGGTGNYKTTLCNYALALYGKDFLMNIIRFGEGATEAGLIKTASVARDLPMLIDNYKPNVGGGEPQLVRIINSIVEGTEKLRLDQRGNFRPSPKLGAWPIVNGETSIESDTAAIARCIEVDFKKSPEAVKNLQEASKNREHLPGLGQCWIKWLASKEGQANIENVKTRWDEIYRAWHIRATSAGVHNAERVAANFSCINIAYALVLTSPLFGWLKEYQQTLDNLLWGSLNRMAKTTKEAREGVRFLEAIRSLIGSGQVILGKTKLTNGKTEDEVPDQKCSKTFIGWDDEKSGELYLIPSVALKEVCKLDDIRITKNSLYQQLDELGAIAEKRKDENTVIKRLAKRNERVLAIHRALLFGEQENIS